MYTHINFTTLCDFLDLSIWGSGCLSIASKLCSSTFPFPILSNLSQSSPVGKLFRYLLGAQKSGSTTLCHLLIQQVSGILVGNLSLQFLNAPNLISSQELKDLRMRKENHFFDNGARYDTGRAGISSPFPKCSQTSHIIAAMDATPAYFGWPSHIFQRKTETPFRFDPQGSPHSIIIRRFKQFHDIHVEGFWQEKMTFLVILRDPVERYLSAMRFWSVYKPNEGYLNKDDDGYVRDFDYNHPMPLEAYVQQDLNMCPFHSANSSSAIERCMNMSTHVLTLGFYELALHAWVEGIPNASFILTTLDQLKTNPNQILRAVATAIGSEYTPINHTGNSNNGDDHDIPLDKREEANRLTAIRRKLHSYYAEWNRKFWGRLKMYLEDPSKKVSFVGTFGNF